MSKIKLTGSNSGYVEISSAADAGNLTLQLPTAGTVLLSNAGNVFSGITTTGQLDINGSIDVSSTSVFNDDLTLTGASYNVVWDKSDNQLEFGDNAKLSFGASSDLQIFHDGTNTRIQNSTNTLRIAGDSIKLNNGAISKNFLVAENDAVQLMYNNSTKFVTTNTGTVITGICTATSFSGSGEGLTRTTQLSHRNLIINGAMQVAQRGTSYTGTNNYNTVDRILISTNGLDENCTFAQVDVSSGTTPYTLGFRKAFKITNGNQTNGAGVNDYVQIQHRLEAQDIANSGWNYKSSSSYITLQFWVKSSVAQNFYCYLRTKDGTGQGYIFETGSLTANTWTKIEKTIPGNSNITINNDNGEGLQINISPFWGTTYTNNSASLNAWGTFSGTARTPDHTSTWYTTNDATFELTGVQLEVGEQATPFEHKRFSDELRNCQRYFQQVKGHSDMVCAGPGRSNGTTHAPFTIPLSVPLRASPTVNACAWAVFTSTNQSNSASQTPAVTKWDAHNNVLTCQLAGLSGMTNARALNVFINSSNTFTMDAEL